MAHADESNRRWGGNGKKKKKNNGSIVSPFVRRSFKNAAIITAIACIVVLLFCVPVRAHNRSKFNARYCFIANITIKRGGAARFVSKSRAEGSRSRRRGRIIVADGIGVLYRVSGIAAIFSR